MKFAFPTLGKEPDFVVLNRKDFADIPNNSVKRFPWGGKLGYYFRKVDGNVIALTGVCTHMECNVTYKPVERRLFCPCHDGWYDDTGKDIAAPPPRPLDVYAIMEEGEN